MRTVYALSSGEYSDYGVKALFETEELAQAALELDQKSSQYSKYDVNRVEVFYLYDELPKLVTRYYRSIELFKNGTVGKSYDDNTTDLVWNFWDAVPATERPQVRYNAAPYLNGRGIKLEVLGTDLKAVQKVFGERKAKWLAEVNGLI